MSEVDVGVRSREVDDRSGDESEGDRESVLRQESSEDDDEELPTKTTRRFYTIKLAGIREGVIHLQKGVNLFYYFIENISLLQFVSDKLPPKRVPKAVDHFVALWSAIEKGKVKASEVEDAFLKLQFSCYAGKDREDAFHF